jgi:quinol-cytochrome oxidoreductase complex cytochrome b subunit
MKKGAILYWTAAAALLLFLLQVFSGFVLWLAISRGDGYRGGRGAAQPPGQEEFLALTRGDWIDIHEWTAVALLVVIGLHLILHWRWIVSVTRRMFVGE